MTGLTGPGSRSADPVEVPRCSSKGCTSDAEWALVWNNPRLHTPDRRKTWVACEAHREHLAGFLDMRGFLREVVPVADAPVDPGP